MKLSELLNTEIERSIAWYPSSGLDFRDLLVLGQEKFIFDKNVFANELFEFDILPDLFVHTDIAYSEENWPLPNSGIIFTDAETEYSILKSNDVLSDNGKVIGKLLNIKLNSIFLTKIIEKKVLFLFTDNIVFFRNFVLLKNIKIDFLINVRDGASENGGASFSLKILEFFLGQMNTKYLISDNFGREPVDIDVVKNNSLLKKYYCSEKNKPTVLQGLKEWSWSEFGLFQGDVFLMKVHKF